MHFTPLTPEPHMPLCIPSNDVFLSTTDLESWKMQKLHYLQWFEIFQICTLQWTPGVHYSVHNFQKIFCVFLDIISTTLSDENMLKCPWTKIIFNFVFFTHKRLMYTVVYIWLLS